MKITNLIELKGTQPVTSSIQVADVFKKEHKNVLRDINNLDLDRLKFEQMFLEGAEPDSYGRNRKVIYMNRDGFALVAMGFTGKKALQFKLQYIDAFNQMAKQLESNKPELVGQYLHEMERRISALEKTAVNTPAQLPEIQKQPAKIITTKNGNKRYKYSYLTPERVAWRDYINAVMEQKDLTRAELGEMLDCSEAYITEIINGNRKAIIKMKMINQIVTWW